jgi:class 3 adenylate cyclase
MANKILIVDDEPFNLDLLEQELMDEHYVIERAGDGVEALAKVDSFAPDVILLDFMMPKMNGVEVLKELRQSERHRSLPVILLTAKATQEDKIAGLDAGADDYVTKPFDSFELLARVRAMLRIKTLHDQLEDWNRTLADKVQEQLNQLQRMEKLKRYLSPQIAATVLGDENDLFKTHRREVTIVFVDLRGFTAFSDTAEPEEVINFLRHYHQEMGQLIFKFEGTLERFMGDGIVIIFNDPIPCENHVRKAVQMTLEMRDRVKLLRQTWLKQGYNLDLGVGLAFGYATLGTVGFEGRMDYGSVGNLPNLAARMCSEAKGGQILTDQKTMSQLDEWFEAESLADVHFKGIGRPVSLFNIVATK